MYYLQNDRPLIYEKDGYIGISTIDGTSILPPDRYFLPRFIGGLMPQYHPGFGEGLVAVANSDGTVGYIDEKGAVALPFIYEYAYPFIGGYAVARSKGKCGMIDRSGRETVPFAYDMILYDGPCADDRYGVAENGKFGYVSSDGAEVIPCIFDIPLGRCSGEFREGVAPILLCGEVFFIDRAGKRVVTPCESFDYVASFERDRAQVIRYKDDHEIYHGYIDKSGSLAVPVQYRQIGCCCSEGVVAVSLSGAVVYTDMIGRVTLSTPYDAVTGFHGSHAWGRKNGCWESFDREGNVLASGLVFDRAIPCGGDLWILRSGEQYLCVDACGNELLRPGSVPPCPYLNLGKSDWIFYCLTKRETG